MHAATQVYHGPRSTAAHAVAVLGAVHKSFPTIQEATLLAMLGRVGLRGMTTDQLVRGMAAIDMPRSRCTTWVSLKGLQERGWVSRSAQREGGGHGFHRYEITAKGSRVLERIFSR